MRSAKPSNRTLTWLAVLMVVAVVLAGLGATAGYLSFTGDDFVWSAPGN